MFDAAISLAGGKGLKDRELCNLCLLYAELEGGIVDPSEGGGGCRAVHVLASLTESSPYKPYSGPAQALNILKARKTYERSLQDALNSPTSASLVTLTGCYALFQYITAGIDAAIAVFTEVAASLATRTDVQGGSQDLDNPRQAVTLATRTDVKEGSQDLDNPRQAVTLMHISLLKHHAKINVYPRAPLRDALSHALRLYPDNNTLWKYYMQTESGSHHIGKVRRFIDAVRRTSEALEPYLFAIRAEDARKKLMESVQR